MYFGSVRFFKHLILSIIGLIFTVLLALTVFFGISSSIERNKAVDAMAKYEKISSEDRLNIPKDMNLDQLYILLKERGYTANDIIKVLSQYDGEAMSQIYKNQFYSQTNGTASEYTALYPDLYATPPKEFVTKSKTIYLTFDDGPSDNTLSILSILEKYNIKATFFMSGSTSEKGKRIMKQVADQGHSIGIHSITHDYSTIYASVDNYLADFNNTYTNIYEATGIKPDIVRFPGGSINNYNRLNYQQIISEVTRRGFVYYDWDVSGEDASANANWTSIFRNIDNGIKGKDRAVILLHDGSSMKSTVLVLEDLILELQKDGYTFDKITNDVKPTNFGYIN